MKKFFVENTKTKTKLIKQYNTQAMSLIPTILPLQDLSFKSLSSPKPKEYLNWVVSEAIVPFYNNAINLYKTKNYVEASKEIESIQKTLDKLDTNFLEKALTDKISAMYYMRARVISEGAQKDPNNALAKFLLFKAIKFNKNLTDAHELLKAIRLEETPIHFLDANDSEKNISN